MGIFACLKHLNEDHLKPPPRNGFLWLFRCILSLRDETFGDMLRLEHPLPSAQTPMDFQSFVFNEATKTQKPIFDTWNPRLKGLQTMLKIEASTQQLFIPSVQVPGTSKRGGDLVSKFNVIFWNISA